MTDFQHMGERRSEIRRDVFCAIDIEYHNVVGVQRLTGVLEDRSPSGAGIRLRAPLELGVTVQVSGPRQYFSAIVQHCRRDGYTYFAGLRIPTG